jgi:hypothetical protein
MHQAAKVWCLAHDTGMRLGDIATLEWTAFDTEGHVTWKADKTNKVHTMEVGKRVANMLTDIPANDPTWVFPEQVAIQRDIKRRSLLPMRFSRLCASLGIEGKSFHCLRHTFATYGAQDKEALAKKLAATLTLSQIASLLGHPAPERPKGTSIDFGGLRLRPGARKSAVDPRRHRASPAVRCPGRSGDTRRQPVRCAEVWPRATVITGPRLRQAKC